MIEIVFWLALILLIYVYAGYPLLVAVLGALHERPVRRSSWFPRVTVVIAAYNEETVISQTVLNKLEQHYPAELLDVLVVSDSSSDHTEELVEEIRDSRVHLLRQEPRAGKTSALNLAITEAAGEIIVFSDANSIYHPDAILNLMENFADPEVGYVTGKMIYVNPDGSVIGDGCSGYMKYENVLRAGETRIGSVVGVDGGIDAVRRDLYVAMNADQLPDFVLPLQVVRQGFRVVYEPRALLWEKVSKGAGDEYRMRVRVSLRAIWALFDMRQLLYGRAGLQFAWQLWSHKLLRYLCFLFLGAILLCNLALLEQGRFYQSIFFIQLLGYLGALTAPVLERAGYGFGLLSFTRYFSLLNLACAHAFGKFVCGKKQVLWTPRKG